MFDSRTSRHVLYDFKKDFMQNFIDGPRFDGPLPQITRAPKEQWVDFLGYKIASRIGIPACAIATSKGIALASQLGFDVLTYKTIRCKPHASHPQPNILYIDKKHLAREDVGSIVQTSNNLVFNPATIAIANSFGNASFDTNLMIHDIKKAKQSLLEGQVLIVSIFGETREEWQATARLAQDAGADIIEANFACPNLNTTDSPIYLDPAQLSSLTKSIVQAVNVPVILKFGIFQNTALLKNSLIAAAQAGARGICGINSVPMSIKNHDGTAAFGTRTIAGVSGNPIRALALDFVASASRIIQEEKLDLMLLGTGGITMANHFNKFLSRGAAVALCATGMMWNPYLGAEYHELTQHKLDASIAHDAAKEKLAARLFDIGAIKFGNFTFKSGIKSPIYTDLRVAMSFPDVLQQLTLHLKNMSDQSQFDVVCGVPYAAVTLATTFSLLTKTPMIMPRKEIKDHGTKKAIEGMYNKGDRCLVIEDVITSGGSILETTKILESEGIEVNDVLVLLNYEKGGRAALTAKGYNLHALFTFKELLTYLQRSNKITAEMVSLAEQAIYAPVTTTQVKQPTLSYAQRADLCTNEITKRFFAIMAAKKTNLVFAADVTTKDELLAITELVGPEICMLKIHADIIKDFDDDCIAFLRALAEKHNFLICEDRKFADIGSTTLLQYTGGLHHIADWADMVTVHAMAGNGTIDALKSSKATEHVAILLIAQMSSANTLAAGEYTQKTLSIADQYKDNVIGLICREKLSNNPAVLHLTPGVQLEVGSDNLGQQYLTPARVIKELGSDIIIVGRGILKAQDPATEARRYKDAAWCAYQEKVNQL